MMKCISIDIETYSSNSLLKGGVYKYVESIDFEILLFSYAVDDGEVQVVDLAKGEKLPNEVLVGLMDNTVTKWAFNAQFERICISEYLRRQGNTIFKEKGVKYLKPDSWRCTMVWAAYLGLPQSLEDVGAILKLQNQKLKSGKDLIRYFCGPCAPTKTNGGRTRNYYYHDEQKWAEFKAYNLRDVQVELGIKNKFKNYPVPKTVWLEYVLDQEVNDRGIRIDTDFVAKVIKLHHLSKDKIFKELQDITKLDNPNSVLQIKEWLASNGIETDSIDKKVVSNLLETAEGDVRTVLINRQKISRSSVKKYVAMQESVCSDGRARGMFKFYGANRTGRFAGKLIQLQNLPRNHMPDLDHARALCKNNDIADIDLIYDDISDVLSQLVRTAFIPNEGMKFVVADFSAIEARVIAWLAGETWRIKAFEKGDDIYCMAASKMFSVPVVKHGVNSKLRQKGKIAELACGYGGSVGALIAMGALDMGLEEAELQPLVDAWRSSNTAIVDLWWSVDNAVKLAMKMKSRQETHGIGFVAKAGMLFIELPSGRNLAYVRPKFTTNKFGGESVSYEGTTAEKKWGRIESYGPKFVENIVQALSRDLLLNAMKNLANYRIVAHVHDEVIIECERETKVEDICSEMAKGPKWAKGLLLNADGYECEFYKKD